MSRLFRRAGARRGFTMIELLTVIGIIVILMSILIPVISTVRKISQNTNTTHFLTKIATACQNYYHDFRSYPGPLPDNAVHGYNTDLATDSPSPAPGFTAALSPTAINPAGATIADVSSSENLVLGLLGGLTFPAGATSASYDATLIPRGPQVLNPLASQQMPAYIDPASDDLSRDGIGNYASMATHGLTFLIPEFMDHYSEPHPIIYLRARAGTTHACDVKAAAGVAGAGAEFGSQYYSAEMAPYAPNFFTQQDRYNNYVTTYTANPVANGYGLAFFQNQALDNNQNQVARGQDAFIMISAGYDGLYGTKDDIIYPSQSQ